jgi:hypothetical protein
MSFDLFDAIGLVGSALVLGAFAYANLTRSLNKLAFNLANLAGAALLLVSLCAKFNLAAFILEAIWASIALFGIAAALRDRRERA